jgi:hypothetical protein
MQGMIVHGVAIPFARLATAQLIYHDIRCLERLGFHLILDIGTDGASEQCSGVAGTSVHPKERLRQGNDIIGIGLREDYVPGETAARHMDELQVKEGMREELHSLMQLYSFV